MKKQKEKLPRAFKKKWVAALRSGKYKQGKNLLYNQMHETYCCLGVAGVICGNNRDQLTEFGSLDRKVHNNIPELLFGISTGSTPYKLSIFNDNGKSFRWIAAYVDRYL